MQCVDLGGRRIIKKKFFQAEDGIRDFCLSRGLGDVYKRQQPGLGSDHGLRHAHHSARPHHLRAVPALLRGAVSYTHLTLPTICSV